MKPYPEQDTICALATAPGSAAIAVIRLSGENAIELCNRVFKSKKKNKNLLEASSHTLHFGNLLLQERIIDEVLVSIFKAPNSYTGENTVEISCHGSNYIQQEILKLFIQQGARQAKPGEFTLRAYLNGKLDLSQAEAVADLIASESESAHTMAMHQMRGGFSAEINVLREKLIHFASLIELELDFAEEDVEFANRHELTELVNKIRTVTDRLVDSFAVGNVIKNGIPVAIVGEPNVGKSTLLNALLNEERAIVSDIAGTTRDTIEDEIVINGISYRFIDTAGIRETSDTIEALGIHKTFEKINQASIVLYLFDAYGDSIETINQVVSDIQNRIEGKGKQLILVANKCDQGDSRELNEKLKNLNDVILISAKNKDNMQQLTQKLGSFVESGLLQSGQTIVSNIRHYEALCKTNESLAQVLLSINNGVSGDFMAIDIRKALYHLGEITGTISTDDLLENIFTKFCIGK